MNSRLDRVASVLNGVGWFVPPYVSVSLLETVALAISDAGDQFTEDQLERVLSFIYTPNPLAAMVTSRYSEVSVVELYRETISEAISAHFSALPHVAVAGLIPVVEGAGRELARNRDLGGDGYIKTVFGALVRDAKEDVIERKIGAVQEIVQMLDAFLHFLEEYFFQDSQLYPLLDKTNRHGILHGTYRDADYGRPINFYKTISAIDILTFVSMLKMARMTGFAPNETQESEALAARYLRLQADSLAL